MEKERTKEQSYDFFVKEWIIRLFSKRVWAAKYSDLRS